MTVAAGFFGKIPTRGDFVRHGLPPDFVSALDRWWQRVIPDSRARLGEGWTDAWMEGPVWRFAFAPGCCGAGAAIGLWLPSTDSAGRLFPLTVALVGARWAEVSSDAFLPAAEAAALRAVTEDVQPAELAELIDAAATGRGSALDPPPAMGSRWWTEGSPLVAPGGRSAAGLPDSAAFAAMLRDEGASGDDDETIRW